MKLRIKKYMTLDDISKYLYPVKEYVQEKINNNMFDDWNEYTHSIKWLKSCLDLISKNSDSILDIYYLEDKGTIIGVIFALSGNKNILDFLNENNVETNSKKVAQLSSFHILKDYRGIGKKWLQNEVLKDLKNQGIEEVYIKSSHNKALDLYNSLGTLVGNYMGISDSKLYQRYGYIYKIDL